MASLSYDDSHTTLTSRSWVLNLKSTSPNPNPMELHQLPIELLLIIGTHLDSKSYQNLRFSGIQVPLSQRMTFKLFKQESSVYKKKFILDLSHVSVDVLVYLLINNQKSEFKRAIRTCPKHYLKTAFETVVSQYPYVKKRILGYCFYKSGIEYGYQNQLPVRLFSKLGHLKFVLKLLKSPLVDPSVNDNEALTSAVQHGHTAIVKALLQDSRVDMKSKQGWCFHTACELGYVDIVLCFMMMGYDPSLYQSKGFFNAITTSQVKVVQVLLEDDRIDPSMDHQKCLRMAVLQGSVDIVRLLISDGRVDVHTQQEFCLRHASRMGYLDLVHLLLQHDCDPSIRDNQPLVWAYESQHWQVCKLLISHPRIVHAKFFNLLLDPQYDCPEDVLELILKYVDPAKEDQFAIRYAVDQNWTSLCRVLLRDPRVDVDVAPAGELSAAELVSMSDNTDLKAIFSCL